MKLFCFYSLLLAPCALLFAPSARAQWEEQGSITFLKESKYVTLESKGLTGVKREKMLFLDALHPLFIRVAGVPVLNIEIRRAFHPGFSETSRPVILTIFEGKEVAERRNLSAEQDLSSRFIETEILLPSQRDNFTLSPPLGGATYFFALPKDFKGGAVIFLGRPLGQKPLAEPDILARGPENTAPLETSPEASREQVRIVPSWRVPDILQSSRVKLWLGLNVNCLLSLGPGDRYLYAPTFLLEAMLKIPLEANFLVPTQRNSISLGVEGGYYFSSGSQTRTDYVNPDIRGDYKVTWDLRVIPLYLNVFYGIPITPKFELSLGAGLGASISYLKPKYDTAFMSGDDKALQKWTQSQSFGYQFIGRALYHTGKVGELIFELRQNQSAFSYKGHPESGGDLGGLSSGIGYNYFLF